MINKFYSFHLLFMIFFVQLLSLGCGPKTPEDTSQLKTAIITQSQLKEAEKAAEETVVFLPFGYTTDGCYARAFYMQIALALRSIPSRAAYIVGNLRISDGTEWSWHVAPVVTLANTNTSYSDYILDPALSGGTFTAMPLNDWIRKMDENHSSRIAKARIAGFNTEGDPGVENELITTVKQMPKFVTGTLREFFSTMDEYLLYEHSNGKTSDTQLINKRGTLKDKSLFFCIQLAAIQMLDEEKCQITSDELAAVQREHDPEE